MKLDANGEIQWVYGTGNEFSKNYRIKIEEITGLSGLGNISTTVQTAVQRARSLYKTRNSHVMSLPGNNRNSRRRDSDNRADESIVELLMSRSTQDKIATTPINSHLKIIDNFATDSHREH